MKNFKIIYGTIFRGILKIINPFKKLFITTACQVHVFNNIQAVGLLKKWGYHKEYLLINQYLPDLNKGSIWADQDFKSINHFYNPVKKRGLFGHSHSLKLTQTYYEKALSFWNIGNKKSSMFYLGACVHIIQDVTIPQHVNIRLLAKHHSYENFVKYTYDIIQDYKAAKEPIILKNPKDYVHYNAKKAFYIDKKYRSISDDKMRFFKQTVYTLPLAQRTTAGFFLMFIHNTTQ